MSQKVYNNALNTSTLHWLPPSLHPSKKIVTTSNKPPLWHYNDYNARVRFLANDSVIVTYRNTKVMLNWDTVMRAKKNKESLQKWTAYQIHWQEVVVNHPAIR